MQESIFLYQTLTQFDAPITVLLAVMYGSIYKVNYAAFVLDFKAQRDITMMQQMSRTKSND